MIKGIPKDKSDSHDSKWIAGNCLDGKIERSRVFSKEERSKDDVAAIVDAFYHLKNRYSIGGG